MVLSTTPRATYRHCCPQGHLPNRVNTDSLVEEVNDRYITWCILPQFPAGEQAQVVDLLHLVMLDGFKMLKEIKTTHPSEGSVNFVPRNDQGRMCLHSIGRSEKFYMSGTNHLSLLNYLGHNLGSDLLT